MQRKHWASSGNPVIRGRQDCGVSAARQAIRWECGVRVRRSLLGPDNFVTTSRVRLSAMDAGRQGHGSRTHEPMQQ